MRWLPRTPAICGATGERAVGAGPSVLGRTMGVALDAVRALSQLTRRPTRLVGEMAWVLRLRLLIPLRALQPVYGARKAHLRGFPRSMGAEPSFLDQLQACLLFSVVVRTVAAGLHQLAAHGAPLCCVIACYASTSLLSPLVGLRRLGPSSLRPTAAHDRWSCDVRVDACGRRG